MNNSPTSGTPAISIRGGSLSFGTRSLWDNLTLDIGRGEYFAVLGPNGSGKSTFLKVVLGLMRMSAGEVSVLGRPAARVTRCRVYSAAESDRYFHPHACP